MHTPRKPLLQHLHDYFFPHRRNVFRPHLFSGMSIAVLVFAVIVFEGAYLLQTKYVFIKTDFLASVLPGALVVLTNQDRAIQGLAGVTEDTLLDKAAQAAALDMAAKGYFAHNSPDGKTPWQWLEQAGYQYSYAGQNLAVNFTDSENVETAWMESPTHRANIVKREYTKVGIGVANGLYEGRETTFVVQFFAAPAKTALATPVEVTPLQEQVSGSPASTTSVHVLGTETSTPSTPSWLARLLASPLHTLLAIFTILFAIIAMALAIAILVRVRIQHPNVLVGGTLLLMFIFTAMLFSSELAGSVQLNSQAASVSAALSY